MKKQYFFLGCALLTLLAALLMVVPLHQALVGGLVGFSLLLFGLTSLVLVMGVSMTSRRTRLVVVGALCISLFCFVVPQYAYFRVAAQNHVSLDLDMSDYLTVSGKTTIQPQADTIYKQVKNQQLRLAVYRATGTGPRPVVMLVHGGGWQTGSHLQTGVWPKLFTDAGYTVASVQYRLSTKTYHTWQDAPADLHDAVVYVKAHSSELGIDPSRITLFGQSAGGELALLEAYRNHGVESVIGLYSPSSLVVDYTQHINKTPELRYIGGTPEEYPNRYQQTSPINYVSATAPRTLLIHGTTDTTVRPQSSLNLAKTLAENNVPYRVLYLPFAGHAFDNQHGGFPTLLAEQVSLQFLSK